MLRIRSVWFGLELLQVVLQTCQTLLFQNNIQSITFTSLLQVLMPPVCFQNYVSGEAFVLVFPEPLSAVFHLSCE